MRALWQRLKQGYRTFDFPRKEPEMPRHYRGLPILRQHAQMNHDEIIALLAVCPAQAVSCEQEQMRIDLGRCIFCGACESPAIHFSREFRQATARREDLYLWAGYDPPLAQASDIRKVLGRSLKLRQVSAGGCNACEADTNVLNTLVYDLARFGVQFVASPRHADGLLITGPVPKNMLLALQKTYAATLTPKLVIAVGACAISGGLFRELQPGGRGVEGILPVDLYIPGCPPHPYTILDGILRLLGRG